MTTAAAETADEFWQIFQLDVNVVREKLSKIVSGSEECIPAIKAEFAKITEYFANSKLSLPPYDVRRGQEILDSLHKDIKDTEAKYRPAKKFSFSKRGGSLPSDAKPSTNNNAPVRSKNEEHQKDPELLPPGSFLICNKNDETIKIPQLPILESATNQGVQVFIKNNQSCTIILPWVSGSVRLEDLANCNIVLGPCSTSVYLENVKNCKLWISCHQLRIHNTTQCDCYVKVNSHPIIEDCKELRFAPYNVSYNNIDIDFETAKLSMAQCWDNVVDFRWHKQTHSPNWSILEELIRVMPPL